MPEPLADRILETIPQVAELYHRLILLVAPAGSGKTTTLQEVQGRTPARLINLNLELCREMLGLTERQRTLQLPTLLSNLVTTPEAAVVLLDNLEVLFSTTLKQDPLRLLQNLSRNCTLVAAWSGTTDGEFLYYGAPEHPEYKRYSAQNLIIVTTGQKPEDVTSKTTGGQPQ